MRRAPRFSHWLVIALLAAASPFSSARAEAPVQAAFGDPQALFEAGEDAYKANRFQEACDLFARAWELKKTYDIAANLGASEARLGRFREAAEHLANGLRLLPPSAPAKSEQRLRQKLDEVRRQVGALKIRANVPGAELKIDSRSAGTSPLAEDVFVDAGAHTVEASAPGYEPTSLALQIGKGEVQVLSMELHRSAIPVATSGPPSPTPTQRPAAAFPSEPVSSGSNTGAYVAGGVTLVALAAGVTSIVLASNAASDADSERATLHGLTSLSSPCDQSTAATATACSDLHSANTRHDLFLGLAIGSFVAAGVGAVATGYFVLSGHSGRVEAAPLLSPTMAGLGVRGRW